MKKLLIFLLLCSSVFGQLLDSKPIPGMQIGGQFADGLVGLWTFAGPTGNLVDSSHYGNHGTIVGPTWQGQGLSFDGVGDYVDLGVTEFVGTSLFADSSQSFTTLAIFKIDSGDTGTIIAKASGTPANRSFQLFVTANDLSVYLRGTQSASVVTGVDDAQWHQVAVTFDKAVARLYFDGIFISTLAVGAAAEETGENIIFGARTGGTGFLLTGEERYVSIYNRALSASEIQALYIDQWLVFPQTPIWMFSGAEEAVGRVIQNIAAGIMIGVFR